jgi:hypothetical protein
MSRQINLSDVRVILGVNDIKLKQIRKCVNEYIKQSGLTTLNGNIGKIFYQERLLPHLKGTFRSVFVSETSTDDKMKLKAVRYLGSTFFHNQHRKVQVTKNDNRKALSQKHPLDTINPNISRLSSKKMRFTNRLIQVYDMEEKKTLRSIVPINEILHTGCEYTDQPTSIDASDLDFDKWREYLDQDFELNGLGSWNDYDFFVQSTHGDEKIALVDRWLRGVIGPVLQDKNRTLIQFFIAPKNTGKIFLSICQQLHHL